MNDCTLYILPFNPTTQTHACHFEACTSFEPRMVTLNEAEIKKGAYTYYLYCESCHGLQISQKHMSQFPDLRKLSEGKHNAFKQIVLGGALAQKWYGKFQEFIEGGRRRKSSAVLDKAAGSAIQKRA